MADNSNPMTRRMFVQSPQDYSLYNDRALYSARKDPRAREEIERRGGFQTPFARFKSSMGGNAGVDQNRVWTEGTVTLPSGRKAAPNRDIVGGIRDYLTTPTFGGIADPDAKPAAGIAGLTKPAPTPAPEVDATPANYEDPNEGAFNQTQETDYTLDDYGAAGIPTGNAGFDTVGALRDAFADREGVYNELLGSPEERKQQAKAAVMFAIAERGLQLASGKNPDGSAMSGSFMSQLAQSAKGLPTVVAKESRDLMQQNQAINLSRMEAAEKQVLDEAQFDAGFQLESMRQMRDRFDSDLPWQKGEQGKGSGELAYDPEKAYGTGAMLATAVNTIIGVVGFSPLFPDRQEAIAHTRTFDTGLLNTLARDINDEGRLHAQTLKLVEGLLAKAGSPFTTSEEAAARYRAARTVFDRAERDVTTAAELATEIDDRNEAVAHWKRIVEKRAELETVISVLEGGYNAPSRQGDDAAARVNDAFRQKYMQTSGR